MEKTTLTVELRDKLFSVIRAGLDQNTELHVLSKTDCEELMKIGARQSILPIIHRGLKKAGAPSEVVKECDKVRLKDTRQYITQNDALQKIGVALDEAHIPYIPLKGAVLQQLYPAPELRTSCDIDVLVRDWDLDKTVYTLEHTTDFKPQKRAYHDISMISTNVHLELHFSIKEDLEAVDGLLSRAWDYAEPVRESRFTFTPEFQIYYVVAHMVHHFLDSGLGIRPFLDLWLLRNKTQFNEKIVQQMCVESGIETFYEACCDLANVWLENAEHNETTDMLEMFCGSGGVYGSRKFKYALRLRERRGWLYLFSRVLLPKDQVK